MSKYEQLIEYIINEDEAKARELFHQIVVEKSREIYESLIDEQDLEEVGGNQVDQMVDEITTDEEGMDEAEEMDIEVDSEEDGEEDEDGMDMGDDGMDAGDDEMDMGDDGDIEGRVMDLEDALDELKAEFDSLMGDDGMDDGMDMGGDDDMGMGGDDDMGMGDEGDEEMPEGQYGMMEAAKKSKKEEMLKDKKAKKMTEAEWIREYVEKIGEPFPGKNTETGEVGAGGTASLNTKSVVAGKNDMGGTAANIAKGGAESDPSGTPNKKPSGLLKDGQDLIGKVQNSPGANAGKSAYKSKAPSVAKNEVGGINDKSPLAK
jgi:hypothetical protein